MSLTLLASNNASTVLASSINASATTLTVNTGAGSLFPSPVSGTSFFKLTLVDAATGQLTEIVHVTARTGDVMTIERAQEGTAARVWSANDIAANMMTAGTLSYILGNFQPLDATLSALAGLATGANKLPYFTGNDTAAQTDLTSVGRDIIGKNTIADILTYLGLGEVINLAGGALQKNQNLADLTDKTEALENLGLGTVVSDTRLGQHEVISGIPIPGTSNPSTAIVPAGAVMTGTIQESRSNTFIFTASITYRRVQKLINGVWTNVDAI